MSDRLPEAAGGEETARPDGGENQREEDLFLREMLRRNRPGKKTPAFEWSNKTLRCFLVSEVNPKAVDKENQNVLVAKKTICKQQCFSAPEVFLKERCDSCICGLDC